MSGSNVQLFYMTVKMNTLIGGNKLFSLKILTAVRILYTNSYVYIPMFLCLVKPTNL